MDGYNIALIFLIPYTRENNLIPPTHFVVETDVKPELFLGNGVNSDFMYTQTFHYI